MKILKSLNANQLLMIPLLSLCFLLTSCNEDEDLIIVTVDDAAELVAFSLANRTYGTIYNLNAITEDIVASVACNESQTDDRTILDTSSDREVSITYTISESYSKSCETEEIITYSFTSDQSLTSIRYDLEEKVSGTWSIEGFQEHSTQLMYNGPYSRSGLWTYNLEEDHTDDVNFTNTFIDLIYENDLDRIISGMSTFSLEGTSTVYEPYSYEGEVEFLGGDISIITFSTGEKYELNLATGEITSI